MAELFLLRASVHGRPGQPDDDPPSPEPFRPPPRPEPTPDRQLGPA